MKKILLLGIVFYGSHLVASAGQKVEKSHKMGGGKKQKHRNGGGGSMPQHGGGQMIYGQQVIPGMPQPSQPKNITNIPMQQAMPMNQPGMVVGSMVPPTVGQQAPMQGVVNQNIVKTITTLDMSKAARLIADIKTLAENFKILSTDLMNQTRRQFSTPMIRNTTNIPPKRGYGTSIYSQRVKDNPAFNPCTQIVNLQGSSVLPGIAPVTDGINPYTGKVIVIDDLPMLQTIRTYLKNLVNSTLFALGLDDACSWNVDQCKTSEKFKRMIPPANSAYEFNSVRPIWMQSIDFIASGAMLKKPFMSISDVSREAQLNLEKMKQQEQFYNQRMINQMY